MNTKAEVVNPINYFTKIGTEIEDILSSNQFSITEFLKEMNWIDKNLTDVSKVTKADAVKIEKIIKVDNISSYLLDFQTNYKSSEEIALKTYKESRSIYKKVNHLIPLLRNEFNDGIDILADISSFLCIEDETEIFDKVKENIALYKISNFRPDDLNLYAWLKRGELDFYNKNLPDYNKEAFLNWISAKEWSRNFRNFTYIKNLPSILEEFGVGLVYTSYLNKTVHGAVRWFNGKPLVQVSDKGKCLATFWYTVFHEFGHVIKHENDEIFEGNLDLPQSKINQKEKEANSFAYDNLFNGDGLRKYVFRYHKQFVNDYFIDETAAQFSVPKLFVAYWMKKALIKSKTINQNIPSFEFNF